MHRYAFSHLSPKNGRRLADRTAFQSQYAENSASLGELLRLFMLIGVVAFGGPAAHVAVMEKEVVTRRRWVNREHFLDPLAATQLLPGPNSTQMTMHIGYVQRDIAGVFVAGLAFIVPAAAITLGVAWAYVTFNELSLVAAMIVGIQPAVLALIAVALVRLAPQAADATGTRIIFAATFAASLAGVNELVVLAAGALVAAVMYSNWRTFRPFAASLLGLPWLFGATTTTAAEPSRLFEIALLFAKFGVTLFGSGYLLFAYLQRDLVERLELLTNAQLIDAIMIGELTPGPLFTVSTVIGYLLSGVNGAIIATIAIFAPSFLFAIVLGRIMPAVKRSMIARHVLRGLGAAVLGIMLAVLVTVSINVLTTAVAASLAALIFAVMVFTRISALAVLPAAAVLGVVVNMLL